MGAEFGDPALPHRYKHLLDAVQAVINVCRDVGLNAAASQVELVLQRLTKVCRPTEFAAIRGQLLSIYEQMFIELDSRKFVRIESDRAQYLDADRLFGDPVWAAFPTAKDDVKSAGNCLAAECATAAVFHLMRTAEIGIRALAYDRDVTVFQNARTMFQLPLELATWEQLIGQLEDAETDIQGYPKTLARIDQFEFYHGANMQIRAFKNAFRNAVMRSRDLRQRRGHKRLP